MDTKSRSENMIQHNGAQYLLSAGHYRDLPEPMDQEYCIMGRSNVGKSSFLNHVLESGSIARVSKTPGKTNCANLFQVNENMIWVDLPGYGYAKVSQTEKIRWSQLIREYGEKRKNLCGIIWLLDIRHVGLRADIEAYNWFCTLGLPLFPVVTKSDKLTQSKRAKQVKEIQTLYHFEFPVVVYSIRKHQSRGLFWKKFTTWYEAIKQDRVDRNA